MVALCDSMFIHVNPIHILVTCIAFGSLARMLKNFMAQRSSSCFGFDGIAGVIKLFDVQPALTTVAARFIFKRSMNLQRASGALFGLVGPVCFRNKVLARTT